ncbi:TIGR03915 family putative DNA repair protein [Cellulosilyticum sp. ST5]|uniref:DUF4130 domain-containing protein n=1 Tax=Cellulosilyticum lentocellum (strain ATCC 49066 / DSM 5427 / NCIMB 11756 / RHM5) TaxID=642492 RepID=F2JNI1_CELLD|nr:TIGR03915 family putative DNA repair protein [Cellulosilyticum lentocellum]ADZ84757.1 hypothetical protein Clole_3061 [Cellulosilyticum lentocellum DSM 5427]
MIDYLYDGTFDGLLTAIFYGYGEREEVHIYKSQLYAPSFFTSPKTIVTEAEKADRVYTSIHDKLSTSTLENVYCAYLSEEEGVETLILNYLKLCYRYTDRINLAKNNDIIRAMDLAVKHVRFEAHRYVGFVRFKEIRPMLFYAQIEPDHHILPLLIEHFEKRFSDQCFMIHDVKRSEVIVYNQKEIFIQQLTPHEAEVLLRTQIDDPFEKLFKAYYTSTTIPERINIKRRNAYMPRRYFKHLVELQ